MGAVISGMVSVVMPSYNCQDFISKSIESVLAQTYQNWELIIVDDCSFDNSSEIAREYASLDSRIRLILMDHNGGPAAARNKATDESRGQYIAFLDSDDLWMPSKLKTQIEAMEKCNALFCYTSYIPFRPDGSNAGIVEAPESIGYKRMLRGSVIGCLTVVYDVTVIGKRYFTEGRNEISGSVYAALIDRLGHEDYVLWLRILNECDAGHYKKWCVLGINEPLAFYRLRDNSFSATKKKAALYQWIIYRRCENIGYLRSVFYFISYMIRGVLKRKGIGLKSSGFCSPPH